MLFKNTVACTSCIRRGFSSSHGRLAAPRTTRERAQGVEAGGWWRMQNSFFDITAEN